MEGVEPLAGERRFAGDGLLKDGCEEDEGVGGGGMRVALGFLFYAQRFVDGVAGVADADVASFGGEVCACVGCGGERRGGGEMDSVGVGLEREGRGTVEEHAGVGAAGADGGDDFFGEREEVGWSEVFLADLDVVDVARGPLGGEGDEGGAAGCVVWAEELPAVSDGVEEHGGGVPM